MLEVRDAGRGFVVVDTDGGMPVMRFLHRHAADAFVAERKFAELCTRSLRGCVEVVPAVY